MNYWYKLFLIGTAGGAGALARYGFVALVQRWLGVGIPLGTLCVNVLGCLLAGFAWAWLERIHAFNSDLRVVILVGFFGAFTTFSTFALETIVLLRSNHWWGALGNILMHNLLGIFALVLGIMLAKAIV